MTKKLDKKRNEKYSYPILDNSNSYSFRQILVRLKEINRLDATGDYDGKARVKYGVLSLKISHELKSWIHEIYSFS